MQLHKITIQPDLPDFYYWTGMSALWKRDTRRAKTLLSTIAIAGIPNAWPLRQLGILYQDDGQWGKSVDLLRQAIALQPDAAEAHYRLGLALRHDGDLELAREHFEQATTLLPEHLDAWKALQEVYQELQLEQIAQEARRVIETMYAPEYAYAVNLGNQIMFLGYRAETTTSGMLRMHYYWKALTPMNKNYAIFVHFGNGTITFQQDHDPHKTEPLSQKQAWYPTSRWRVGELIHEVFEFSAPSGMFTVKIGAWDPVETKQRLPLMTSSLADRIKRAEIVLGEKIVIP